MEKRRKPSEDLKERIRHTALKSGLDLVGFASAQPFEGYRWQDSKMRDPGLAMPQAESIVVAGVCELKFLKSCDPEEPVGLVSRSYAAGHEYNLVEELDPIRRILEEGGYRASISPATIAASTIPMKLAAVRAGLGWQGKHSVVITGEFGSWVSFGGLITDAVLWEKSDPLESRCGNCTACIDACPTHAIVEPYVVDRRACLDDKVLAPGILSERDCESLGIRVVSCDACLEACPYSRKILKKGIESGSRPFRFNLLDLLDFEDKDFLRTFGGLNWSIAPETFKRNVIVALGNSGGRAALDRVAFYKDHGDEGIRHAALSAMARIGERNPGIS